MRKQLILAENYYSLENIALVSRLTHFCVAVYQATMIIVFMTTSTGTKSATFSVSANMERSSPLPDFM